MKFVTNVAQRLSGRHLACLEITNYKNKKILDLGCSYGWFEKYVSKSAKEIFAIDLNKEDLKKAEEETNNKNVKFSYGSALNLKNFGNGYFDIVVLFDVIEHLPKNSENTLFQEIKRVLKKGGELVISTPKNNATKFLDPAWYFGHRHYSSSQMHLILKKNRFCLQKSFTKGNFFELISMILFYPCKWFFNSEIPFKKWFDKKREQEYLKNLKGWITLFVIAKKNEE